ncbi:PilZ domain-containing protein [Pontixanthobacter aestiaquae]|uniref:PilZ domain-containing protein n=1 Tax=Pontixanthobacter aestiaquae TaxID=1509367 RepID=A0A844Z926_9SPHN|nr:PilZ domain-containing protein [Pontixanthobacter aestiaquae]MDN3645005.1 PilZ domain-containing protein [Pontixanthobacter aestiaquae]MXO83994.1 hypothetical protein [Pontixanthobacter aestiaquae]
MLTQRIDQPCEMAPPVSVACSVSDFRVAPVVRGERRRQTRLIDMYRLCCLQVGNSAGIGVIRNISVGGAQIQSKMRARIGQEVRYQWENTAPIVAIVTWIDGDRMGVRHIEPYYQYARSVPTPPVRIPCAIEVEVSRGDAKTKCVVANMSYKGLCLLGVDDILEGTMVRIEGAAFPAMSVTVTRKKGRMVEASFREDLTPAGVLEIGSAWHASATVPIGATWDA